MTKLYTFENRLDKYIYWANQRLKYDFEAQYQVRKLSDRATQNCKRLLWRAEYIGTTVPSF